MKVETSPRPCGRRRARRIRPPRCGFLSVHLAALGVFAVGFSWKGVALCASASYYLRMFAITAGFHRYFSHRTYDCARAAVPAGRPRPDRARRRACCGGPRTTATTTSTPTGPRTSTAPCSAGSGGATWAGSCRADHDETDYSTRAGPREVPRAASGSTGTSTCPTAVYGVALYLAFGWTGLFYGYFLSTVAPLARHLHDQQRHARLRPPRLRDDRRLAQQLHLLARDDGRGLAQQPPLGAGLRRPGLPLVGDRPELLPALARRERSGSSAASTGRPQRWREAAHRGDATGRAFRRSASTSRSRA